MLRSIEQQTGGSKLLLICASYKALLESHFHASVLNGVPESLRSLNDEGESTMGKCFRRAIPWFLLLRREFASGMNVISAVRSVQAQHEAGRVCTCATTMHDCATRVSVCGRGNV